MPYIIDATRLKVMSETMSETELLELIQEGDSNSKLARAAFVALLIKCTEPKKPHWQVRATPWLALAALIAQLLIIYY
ncbi:MAG: hypothetical protein LBQ86_01325, partial [Holophagales bacterium]|nr:hypothetical protein [Holophagales bacterium]